MQLQLFVNTQISGLLFLCFLFVKYFFFLVPTCLILKLKQDFLDYVKATKNFWKVTAGCVFALGHMDTIHVGAFKMSQPSLSNHTCVHLTHKIVHRNVSWNKLRPATSSFSDRLFTVDPTHNSNQCHLYHYRVM